MQSNPQSAKLSLFYAGQSSLKILISLHKIKNDWKYFFHAGKALKRRGVGSHLSHKHLPVGACRLSRSEFFRVLLRNSRKYGVGSLRKTPIGAKVLPWEGGLSKWSQFPFTRVSEITTENAERLGRKERPGIEPGSSFLYILRAEPLASGATSFVRKFLQVLFFL